MAGESQAKLIVASNRLPYSITADQDGNQNRTKSVSGLVTTLETLSGSRILWMGGVAEEDLENFQTLLQKETKKKPRKKRKKHETKTPELHPVPIRSELLEKHTKYSNGILWPFFHGMLEKVDESADQSCWEGYKEVNQVYANAIAEKLSKTKLTIVWIHDFHLFLVPKLLKKIAEEQKLRCKIGFFLHIPCPFPSEKMSKVLPNFTMKEILEGLLGSDSIGFHTKEYSHNFLHCCAKHEYYATPVTRSTSHNLLYQGRKIVVQAVPAGIVYETFSRHSEGQLSKEFPGDLKELVDKLAEDADKIFMIGVDRIDYTKGLLEKVEAFVTFHESHREDKVLYLQIAVPCREKQPKFDELREELKQKDCVATDSLKDGQSKIKVHYEKVSPENLCVLYNRADVALVTPLIDGLNLVALEYIACQKKGSAGVLILSRNTGAAEYLGGGALKVDPTKDKIADAIHKAITMPKDKRERNMETLQKEVAEKLDAGKWVDQSLRPLKPVFHLRRSKRLKTK